MKKLRNGLYRAPKLPHLSAGDQIDFQKRIDAVSSAQVSVSGTCIHFTFLGKYDAWTSPETVKLHRAELCSRCEHRMFRLISSSYGCWRRTGPGKHFDFTPIAKDIL